MKGNRFYTVPYDARNDTKILKLGKLQRGKMLAFGRWQALLGMMFDEDGIVDLSDETTRIIVREELDFKTDEQLSRYLNHCAAVGLISADVWEAFSHVVNEGVIEQLAFKANKAGAGKRGGRGKKKQESESESKEESNS